MIIYSNTSGGFCSDVDDNIIVNKIETSYIQVVGHPPGDPERNSWNNSLKWMESAFRKASLPEDCGVLVEYSIPSTGNRVDVIVTGHDSSNKENFVIVELKQWEEARETPFEATVNTYTGGANRDVPHPSYQAYSYQQLIQDMKDDIENIGANSCAYLHNYRTHHPEPLLADQYRTYIEDARLFFADNVGEFRSYLKEKVGNGNGMDTLWQLVNGKLRPTKKLIDYLVSTLDENEDFHLINEQMTAYSYIMKYASKDQGRHTVIVKGGPGTGKSVIAVKTLASLLSHGLDVRFVAPNAAFRTVLVETINKSRKYKSRAKKLFLGSSGFYADESERYDVLVVDEAHRLKDGTAFMYKGENQVEDVIKASRTNVFFVDDSQVIRASDIGSVSEIKRVASLYHSSVHEIELVSQFRCSGADGYLNWLHSVLQLGDTGNMDGWDKDAFEFRVMDTPQEVFKEIEEKCSLGFKARMVAGFAWPWTKADEGNAHGEAADVAIPEYNFAMPWNSRDSSMTWAINESGVKQAGCIHTSQGLEFDYVGVLIGNDLKYDPSTHKLYGDYNEYKDTAGKAGLKGDPEKLTRFICNIYKVLMSRGMKGCYVFCRDKELERYLKGRMG